MYDLPLKWQNKLVIKEFVGLPETRRKTYYNDKK